MVETQERERIYTTDQGAGPSTALVVLFSLLIVAVLGFMVYFFSNNDLRNNTSTVIEHDTQTTTPVPITTPTAPPTNINIPAPSTSAPAPAPNINIMPNNGSSTGTNSNGTGSDDTNTPNSSAPSSTPGGQSTTP